MVEHRHNIRVNCADKCVLHMRNWLYMATVKNISFGGALVHSPVHDIRVGEKCSITINGTTLREYFCKVVRIKSSDIGLMFTGMQRRQGVAGATESATK